MKIWALMFFVLSLLPGSPADCSYKVAITFDDLPAAGSENPLQSRIEVAKIIIKTLQSHKITKVYGFVNGILAKEMDERRQILKLWKQSGFLLGNHTFSHLDFGKVSADEFIQDIEKNEPILIDHVSELAELKWLRYPYLQEGETKEKRYAVRSYLAKRNYRIAPVSIDLDDWSWNEPYLRCLAKDQKSTLTELERSFEKHSLARLEFADKIVKKIYGSKKSYSHILLLHFNSATAHYLDRLLTAYEKHDVQWVTFQDAMMDPVNNEDMVFFGPTGKTNLLQGAESRRLNLSELVQPQVPRTWLEGQCN